MVVHVRRLAGVAVLFGVSACGSASRNPAEHAGEGGGGTGAAGGPGAAKGGNGASGGNLGAGGSGGASSAGTVGGGARGLGGATGSVGGIGATGGTAGAGAFGAIGGDAASGGNGPSGGGGGAAPTGCSGPNIDVPVFVVSGTVTNNVGALKADLSGLAFRNGSERLPVTPGTTTGAYSVRLVPGTYDIFYGELSPLRLGVTVGPSSPTTLDLEAKLVQVSVTASLNGGPFGSSKYATLALKNGHGTQAIGDAAEAPLSIVVAAGSYDLIYDGSRAYGSAPRNSGAKLQTVVTGASDTALNVDIRSVVLSGRVRRGGTAVSGSALGVVAGTLTSAALGQVPLAVNDAGEYSVHVLPGTYDFETTGTSVTGLVVPPGTNTQIDIDLPEAPTYSATVQGSVKFNGQPVLGGWGFVFYETASEVERSIAGSGPGYSLSMLPGTYDIFYGAQRDNSPETLLLPRNSRAPLQRGVRVKSSATTTLDLDAPVGVLRGKFTIGGAPLPDVSGDGSLWVRGASGDEVQLASNYDGDYSFPLIAGDYDVYFKVGLFGSVAPRNAAANIARINLTRGDNAIDIDVPTRHIQGTLTVSGVTVGATNDVAKITLQGPNGDTVPLGSASAKTYSTTVVPGTYDIYFSGSTRNTFAPMNQSAKIGCLKVP
ncbi:MAG TPA: hypothetical protein VFQ35_10095 [Polyangiaceae bacterium]|nr:hypothetical protein [Polyangiaceae bacterium]